jgi:Plasmid encoded RepA protein
MEPAKGIEPPTYGLRNHSSTVLPVRNRLFPVGSDVSHSGPITQVGHEYAPQNAPRNSSAFVDKTSPDHFEELCGRFYRPGAYGLGQEYAPRIRPQSDIQCVSPPSVPTSHDFRSVTDTLPRIGISKRRLKQLEAIQLIREQRDTGEQALAFHARPFVLCGIPLCPLTKDQLAYKRRNGKFFLQIIGHPDFGLPFGQDRLIPIWVATLALRQKSRTVDFHSAAQILDFFRLPKDGRYYRRIAQGFQRIFAATIFFGTEDQPAGNHLIDWARFHIFNHLHLWFTEGKRCGSDSACHDRNTITLSEAFHSEIDQHRLPIEREVVIALANSPGALDFYVWIAWKSWVLKGSKISIPLFSPGGLREQLGRGIHPENRFLRRKINHWLQGIRARWPQCPAQISTDCQSLIISSSKPSPALRHFHPH